MTRVRRPAVLLALLLVLFAARLVDTARRTSFTYDEPHYVATGLYLWQTGDYQWAVVLNGHPPLAFHLASLPLLVYRPASVPVAANAGFEVLRGATEPPRLLRLASRSPFIALAAWGAVLLYLWAREVAGAGAGLLAVFVYTFDPTLLGNAALAHSDITVTVLWLQTMYLFWRWWRRPTRGRLVLCGLSLGLALLAKLSAAVLLASLGLLVAAAGLGAAPALGPGPLAPPAGRARRVGWALLVLGALLAIATAVLWAGYGGSFATTADPREPFAHLTIPGWVRAFLFDAKANAGGRTTFLLGRYSRDGWWYFFPVAVAVKTPLAVLGLLVLAAVRRPPAGRPALGAVVAVPAAVYALVACFVLRVPLGLRYLLPLYPLGYLFLATRLAAPAGRAPRALVALACVWLAGASLWIHPHYLAYFNEAVGGPRQGYRWLVESNLDWGQDLPALARWLHARGDPPVHLAYFGRENPATYGIRATPLAGCAPVTGLVAISANVLQELYRPGVPLPPPRGCYAWLRALEPVATPGYSIRVYDVPPAAPGAGGAAQRL